MFDLGWSELLVIGVVALIVVGPKDLPIMFRRMGEFTGRARAMAREFSSAMNKAADETGVNDISRDLRTMSKGMNSMTNPRKMGLDALTSAAEDVKKDLTGVAPNTAATTPPVPPVPPVPSGAAASGTAAPQPAAVLATDASPATDDKTA